MNTDISSATFEQVVLQFHKGNFFVNINLECDEEYPIITATRLQAYLIDKCGAQFLFDEARCGQLSDRSRCILVDYIAKFLHEIADGDINRNQKIMTARAAVTLFPSFKTDSEQGYVHTQKKSI